MQKTSLSTGHLSPRDNKIGPTPTGHKFLLNGDSTLHAYAFFLTICTRTCLLACKNLDTNCNPTLCWKNGQNVKISSALTTTTVLIRSIIINYIKILKFSIFPDPALLDEKRKRPVTSLSVEELESRVLLSKEWSRYCLSTHKDELHQLQVQAKSRQDALRELKKISPKLFDEAIKVNQTLFPMTLNGPVDTPPFKDYVPPDLDDVNTKRK